MALAPPTTTEIQSDARHGYTVAYANYENRLKRHPDVMPFRRPTEPVTPRIVCDHGWRRHWGWIAGLAALALWSWLTFNYAQRQANIQSGADAPALDALAERVAALEQDRAELMFDATRHARDGQVDRDTAESLDQDIAALRADVQSLRSEVAALRRQASGAGEQLVVKDFRLMTTEQSARYRYAFTLARAGAGQQRMEGSVSLHLNGERAGTDIELALDNTDQRLGFRQFQAIEGEIVVPEDFLPRQITIDIQPSAKQFQPARLVFNWQPEAG